MLFTAATDPDRVWVSSPTLTQFCSEIFTNWSQIILVNHDLFGPVCSLAPGVISIWWTGKVSPLVLYRCADAVFVCPLSVLFVLLLCCAMLSCLVFYGLSLYFLSSETCYTFYVLYIVLHQHFSAVVIVRCEITENWIWDSVFSRFLRFML